MASTPEYIFYDGHCGLCHRWVRRVLSAGDRAGHFVFSPLQGDFIGTRLDDDARRALPDSIVVQTGDGSVLTRSSAVLHVMRRLGGCSAFLAGVGRLIPRPIRDLGYAGVARIRHHLFARPQEACPLMPPEMRARFRM